MTARATALTPARWRRLAELLPTLVRREIRTRYQSGALDAVWALVTPVAVMATYGLILTQAFDVTGGCAPYLSSAWTGLVVWTFFSSAVGAGVHSLRSSADLITKVYFPKEAIPLAVTCAALVDLAVGIASLALLLVVQSVEVGLAALWAVVPLTLALVWAAALATATSALAVFSQNVVHAVNLLLRVGFFATAVVYETSALPATLAWTAEVNPITVSIDAMRDAVLCASRPDLPLLSVHLGIGVVLLTCSLLFVRRVESRIVDAS